MFRYKVLYLLCYEFCLMHVLNVGMYKIGWASWNLSYFEFKFDDTRLSSSYKNKSGPIEIFVCCVLMLLSLCPVGCLSLEKLNWDSQQGNVTVQQTKMSIEPFLFLYYEVSLASSNLNSKQLRFHGVGPNVYILLKSHEMFRLKFRYCENAT